MPRLIIDAVVWCIVDEEDYEWARQWKWHWQQDKHKRKFYVCRNTSKDGSQIKVYLHKEILRRAGVKKRSRAHTIGDHRNGNSLDDRRANLRWATPKQNAWNKNGKLARRQKMSMNEQESIPEPRLPTGYRKLTSGEIDLIDALKEQESALLQSMKLIGENTPDINQRSLALARTNIQQGFMWYIRAIARPNGE